MSNELDMNLYIEAMREKGKADAIDFQSRAKDLTGTEMYDEEEKIPDFQAAKTVKNMLEREIGFICKSTAGRVVKLLQNYDSDTYPQEPEELDAQWGFKWSTNPKKALPFIQKATSTYDIDECCTAADHVWSSKIKDNNWSPETNPEYWNDLGTIEYIMSDDYVYIPPEEQPEDEIKDFVQPTGTHDAYNTGDKVRFNGRIYESLVDNNVYSPEAYPQNWKDITEQV